MCVQKGRVTMDTTTLDHRRDGRGGDTYLGSEIAAVAEDSAHGVMGMKKRGK